MQRVGYKFPAGVSKGSYEDADGLNGNGVWVVTLDDAGRDFLIRSTQRMPTPADENIAKLWWS